MQEIVDRKVLLALCVIFAIFTLAVIIAVILWIVTKFKCCCKVCVVLNFQSKILTGLHFASLLLSWLICPKLFVDDSVKPGFHMVVMVVKIESRSFSTASLE